MVLLLGLFPSPPSAGSVSRAAGGSHHAGTRRTNPGPREEGDDGKAAGSCYGGRCGAAADNGDGNDDFRRHGWHVAFPSPPPSSEVPGRCGTAAALPPRPMMMACSSPSGGEGAGTAGSGGEDNSGLATSGGGGGEGEEEEERERRRSRIRVEFEIVQSLTATVLEHGRMLLEGRGQPQSENHNISAADSAPSPSAAGGRRAAASQLLTQEEREVFNKQTYLGTAQGGIAGLATFAVLFGGMRSASALRRTAAAAFGRRAPPAANSRSGGGAGGGNFKLPPAPKRSYRHLDGGGGAAAGSGSGASRRRPPNDSLAASAASSSSSQSPPLGIGDDVAFQLQFLISGAIGVVAMGITANVCSDRKLFYRRLADLPLKGSGQGASEEGNGGGSKGVEKGDRGMSHLCRSMCPALIDQMGRMAMEEAGGGIGEDIFDGTKFPPLQQQGEPERYAISEILAQPQTEELRSMVRLVRNCRQRLALEERIVIGNDEEDEDER